MTFEERFGHITNSNLNLIEDQMMVLARSKDLETTNYVKGALFGFEFSKGLFLSKRFKRKFLEELYIRVGMEEYK